MSDILCVTNRALCQENFLKRIQKLAEAHPAGIIFREKDLSQEEYRALAKKVLEICHSYHTPCILHSFVEVARELQCRAIHLPLPILRELSSEQKAGFIIMGASCHSMEEALEAEWLGCTYIIVGHIFDTDCKQGLPGRGVDFLKRICECVSIPVYAIGGINEENIVQVRKAGAGGACVMSGAMACEDPRKYLATLQVANAVEREET